MRLSKDKRVLQNTLGQSQRSLRVIHSRSKDGAVEGEGVGKVSRGRDS